MSDDVAHDAGLDLDALRTLLGVDASGSPALEARQAVALIRHPHTPWSSGEAAEERLSALLVSPLALNLRGTAWQGLLANELTGQEPKVSDRSFAERAQLAGTSTRQLMRALRPLIGLFDESAVSVEIIAADHMRILFPEFSECAELWSSVFNEHAPDSSRAAAEERATGFVLDSLADSDLPPDESAHRIGQFREAQFLLACGRASQLLDGLRVRDTPLQGWATWATLVTEHLVTIHRDRSAAQGTDQPWIDPVPHDLTATSPRPAAAGAPTALGRLLEAYGNEPIRPTTRHPGTGLLRYLRCGFRYWHVWGAYSQLYDALLAAAHAVGDEASGPTLEPGQARPLAACVHDYLYIGHDTGHEPVPLPEITELPLNGWEVRTLFPELTVLMSVIRTGSQVESFARARTPAAIGLAPVIGEIAELLALATTEADLRSAMAHLGGAPGSLPEPSWRTWLADLSADLEQAAAAPAFNPEP
jgi:hypothetical protein